MKKNPLSSETNPSSEEAVLTTTFPLSPKHPSKQQASFRLAQLLTTYQSLLSSKQILYLHLHWDEDLSLQEIADNYGVSKTAVYDSIQKGIKNLEKWESNLHLQELKDREMAILNKFAFSESAEVQKILELLKISENKH